MTDIMNPEMQTVIERVKKLLALASNNPNENEAAAASAKAMKMLEDWNLDVATVEASSKKATGVERSDAKTFGGFYKWQTAIWTAVAELNFCMYWRVKGQGRDKWDSFSYSHRVLGRKENVISTEVMAEYLQQTVERLAQERSKAQGVGPLSREIIAYREGMASRLVERLNDLRRKRLAEDEAKRKAEQAKYGADHPSTSTAVVLQDVINNERDLNQDFLYGWEPGTTARRRAQWRAEWAAEEQRQREWEAAHPEEAAAKKAKEAKERAKQQAKWDKKWERQSRRSRAETPEEKRRSLDEYWEGREKANDIGLDQQLKRGDDHNRLK